MSPGPGTPENHCYYSAGARTILAAMLDADVILLTSPVYALHLTGRSTWVRIKGRASSKLSQV